MELGGVVVVDSLHQHQHDSMVRDVVVAKDVFAPDDEEDGVASVLVNQALLGGAVSSTSNINSKIPFKRFIKWFLSGFLLNFSPEVAE